MPAPLALAGRQFGYLTAVERVGVTKQGAALWLCQCSCGTTTVVRAAILQNGHTKSCGCHRRRTTRERRTTHGHSRVGQRTRTYKAWCNMRQRCTNPKDPEYENWGGRGITVCGRWDSFENFLADMGDSPPGLMLDRIDNEGNYEPGNCRWTDKWTQSRNRRRSGPIPKS